MPVGVSPLGGRLAITQAGCYNEAERPYFRDIQTVALLAMTAGQALLLQFTRSPLEASLLQ